MLSQLNNSAISNQPSLELEKRKLQESFNKVLNEISTIEELNILKNFFTDNTDVNCHKK